MATVRKIFELAAAILFEEKGTDDDFDKYAPRFLERLLVEALPYENMIRRQAGRAALDTVPEIGAVTVDSLRSFCSFLSEICWEVRSPSISCPLMLVSRLSRLRLTHGLASCFMGDDNNKKAEMVIEYNKFVQALEEAAPAVCDMERADDA